MNLFKRSKKKNILLSKFNQLEKDLKVESKLVITEDNERMKKEAHQFHDEKNESIDSSVYEEEVFWWESLNQSSETLLGESPIGSPAEILNVFKKTELYNKVSGLSEMEMNYYDDGKRNVITVMWSNSYLNLSDRRSYLKSIEEVCVELSKNSIKCSLIHDNKRLAISNRIGVKLVSVQDFDIVSEESMSSREVAI